MKWRLPSGPPPLAIAAAILVGWWLWVFAAPAAAPAEGSFTFKLPYAPGRVYDLQQVVHIEAGTGEYRPDDLATDMHQVVAATVQLDEKNPSVVTARFDRIIQRGDLDGHHRDLDVTDPNDLPASYGGSAGLYLKMPFQADIDGSGKLTHCKGARDAEPNQDPFFLDFFTKPQEYRTDWARQVVEEPTLYLPPGPAAVGDTWVIRRTLLRVGELNVGAAQSIAEEIHCKLASVAGGAGGRVAVIEIEGIIGQDISGQTCLKKSGRVEYNLDLGALVSHRVKMTGTLIRTSRLRPVEVTGTVTTSLLPHAEKMPAGGLPAGLPSLGKDGQEIFVFDHGSEVIEDQAGKAWTVLPTPASPDAAQRQAGMTFPVEVNDPRQGAAGPAPSTVHTSMVIDLAGQPWWRRSGHGGFLGSVKDGRYDEHKLNGTYSERAIEFPLVHGVTGHDFYIDGDNTLMAPDLRTLEICERGVWRQMPLPFSGGDVTLTDQQEVLFRRVGKTLYMARDFEPLPLGVRCSLLGYSNGSLYDTGVVSSQQVTFLGQHEGKLLVGTSNRLWLLETIDDQPADRQALAQLVVKLEDDSHAVREGAFEELQKSSRAAAAEIQRAIDASTDPEQKLRLRTVLKRLAGVPTARLIPTKLGGYESLDFVFQARNGMQFYRPWTEGSLEAENLLLCTDGGQSLRKIKLPRQDRSFQLQLETQDGKVLGRDSRCCFELDLKTLQFRDLFSLGRVGADRSARVVAAKEGKYCLAVNASNPDGVKYFWYDPAGPAGIATLPGRAIADGVSGGTNFNPDLAIAPGLDGRLWMLRRAGPVQSQLAYAKGPAVTVLPPRFIANQAALFPLLEHAVLVVPINQQPVALHLGETVIQSPRLHDLIADNYKQMLNLVPDATAYQTNPVRMTLLSSETTNYTTGAPRDDKYLLRLGDEFWLKETYFQVEGRNSRRMMFFRGLYSGQQWRDVSLGRVVGLDAPGKKILAFNDRGNKLFWMSSQAGNPKIDPVTSRDFTFGWCWYDTTNLPYYRSAMVMTEAAVDQTKEKLTAAARRAESKAEDFPGFRMWNGSDWVAWDGSLWGGSVFTDGAGGVWHVRQREVVVQSKDGKRQRLELDDAMDPEHANLVQESPGVVWLATDQSVVRLVAEPKNDGYGPYRVERRFSTGPYGYGIRGPWIVGGKDFYFASGETLFHVPLAELTRDR